MKRILTAIVGVLRSPPSRGVSGLRQSKGKIYYMVPTC